MRVRSWNKKTVISKLYRIKSPRRCKKLLKALSERSYVPFVVVCHARSGSNWLLSLLSSDTRVRVAWEVFHPTRPFLYDNYLKDEFEIKKRDQNPYQFLGAHIFKNFSPSTRAVGFKLFYDHLDNLDNLHLLRRCFFSSPIKLIHLYRENLLKTYVSLQFAKTTGAWVNTSHQRRLFVDRIHFEQWRSKMLFFREQNQNLIDQVGGCSLSYEELQKNPDFQLSRIQEYLGLSPKSLQSNVLQQESRPLSSILSNHAQLAQAWAGTPLEKALE